MGVVSSMMDVGESSGESTSERGELESGETLILVDADVYADVVAERGRSVNASGPNARVWA